MANTRPSPVAKGSGPFSSSRFPYLDLLPSKKLGTGISTRSIQAIYFNSHSTLEDHGQISEKGSIGESAIWTKSEELMEATVDNAVSLWTGCSFFRQN